MWGRHRVLLEQAGHEGAQPRPKALRPEATAVPERGGQDVQGLRDPRGGLGAQAVFEVTHDLPGTGRPVPGLWADAPLSGPTQGQVQDTHQELPSGGGHKQAGISLQGEDGVNSTWGGTTGRGGRDRVQLGQRHGAAGTLETQGLQSLNPARWGGRVRGPASPRSEAGTSWGFTGLGV